MTDVKLTSEVIKCQNCHTKGYMELIGTVARDNLDLVQTDEGTELNSDPTTETWHILLCPNCEAINIACDWINHLNSEYNEKYQVIYPSRPTAKAPDKITLQFRAASELMFVNPAAAVNQFRVVIEMIWFDWAKPAKNTEKPPIRGKSGMIKKLIDMDVFSGVYAEMADVLANIGNKGSHFDEKSVTQDDAKIARELCEAILSHVYEIHPKGMKSVEKLEKRFPRENGWRNGEFIDKPNWKP